MDYTLVYTVLMKNSRHFTKRNKQSLEEKLPMSEENKIKWIAVLVTVMISGLLTYWGINGIGEYGMALFVLTPLFIGVCPVIIYGRKKSLSRSSY